VDCAVSSDEFEASCSGSSPGGALILSSVVLAVVCSEGRVEVAETSFGVSKPKSFKSMSTAW